MNKSYRTSDLTAGARIMLVAQRPSDFVEMKRCAEALASRGYKMIIFYFMYGAWRTDEIPVLNEMLRLREAGVLADARVFDLASHAALPVEEKEKQDLKPAVATARPSNRMSFAIKFYKERVPEQLRQIINDFVKLPLRSVIRSIRRVVRMAYVPAQYRKTLSSIKSTLGNFELDAIILPEDVVGAVTPLVIKAGHHHGVPSIILPYTIANQAEAFQSLRSNPSYQKSEWPNYLAGSLFPKWVMQGDGVALVRLPAPHIMGQELTRTAPPDPWMMNSGFADIIAVENDAMRDYYRAAGIPKDKMRVVGAIYDDALASFVSERTRNLVQLRQELGIVTDRPLLVIGGCPDQSKSCPKFSFYSMDAFCERLALAVRQRASDYEIIVRPHPNFAKMGEMLKTHGIRVTNIDTARLVSLCDAYIAFGSATIRWAIACAVPTINYDVFGYNYSDFKTVAGVENVSDIAAFDAAVEKLKYDGESYGNWKELAQVDAKRWGTLDGRSVARISELIEEYRSIYSTKRNRN